MTRMAAQEHLGWVEALQSQFGTARNDATIAAALAGIGSSQAILILSMAGDGIWTINNNITIPINVTLMIPPGVTVNATSGHTFTVLGPLLIYNLSWHTGAGTFTLPSIGTAAATGFGPVAATGLLIADPQYATLSHPSLVVGGSLQNVAGAQPTFQVYPYVNATDGPAIDFLPGSATPTNVWRIVRQVQGGGAYLSFYNQSVGQGALILGGVGVGMGNILPTHVLHLGIDDALKATTLWSVPCSTDVKDIIDEVTDGLERVRRFPRAIRFVYNGKAQTPNDGVEHLGYRGEDVQMVEPGMIRTYEDKLLPEDVTPTPLLTANFSALVPLLVSAVQELAAQIETLTAKMATLEGRRAGVQANG